MKRNKNKHLTLPILMLLVPLFVWQSRPIVHKDEQTREIAFANANQTGTLGLYNINGDMTIEGYNGKSIKMTVTRTIKAESQAMLQKALRELSLRVDSSGQQVWVYLDAPFIQVCRDGNHLSYRNIRHNDDYHFNYAFKVLVPPNTSLYTSTINGGIEVSGTSDTLNIHGINGSIELNNVSGITEANTINGSIEAHYVKAPDHDCRYSTINGDIRVFYPPNLSAVARLQTMHGNLYTDMDNWRVQPVKEVVRNGNHKGEIQYRISRNNRVKFGNGGPVYHFKTLNGDIIIKKNQ
ncbi:MAG TPA: hypothetical protein VKA08_14630 [Balneolales bacterium]|nr:hypothetical protein [Balneolales bacterium]